MINYGIQMPDPNKDQPQPAPDSSQNQPQALGVLGSNDPAITNVGKNFGVQRDPQYPAYVPGPMDAAMGLGPDLGGYVQGVAAVQDYKLKQNADARAEEELGISKADLGIRQDYLKIAQEELGLKKEDHANAMEEFGWKRQDRAKQQDIMNGMTQAAKDGGYGGVIDYLKIADPAQAIQFHAKKLELDAALMNNDVMKTVQPAKIGDALAEGYGVVGKMGTALLNAPADQRQSMFDGMKPMLQAVFGDKTPKTLQEAAPMFLAAQAQSTPASLLYNAQKQSLLYSTDIGKYDALEQSLIKQGATPENSQVLRDVQAKLTALRSNMDKANNDALTAELQKNHLDIQNKSTQQKDTESVINSLQKSSSDFNKSMDTYSTVKSGIESLKIDPNNSYAQSLVQRMFIKSVNSGAMSISDEKLGDSATGMPGLQKKLANMVADQKENLTPEETNRLAATWEQMMRAKYERQKGIEAQRLESASKYGNVIQDAVTSSLPSKQYEKIQDKANNMQILNQYKIPLNVPEEDIPMIVQAIKANQNNPAGLAYIRQKAAAQAAGNK